MKICSLLILFFAIVSVSKSQEVIDSEENYQYVIQILKGLTKNENKETKCIDIIEANKDSLIEKLLDIRKSFREGGDIASTLLGAGLKLMNIQGMIPQCRIYDIITTFTNTFLSEAGIKKIGERLLQFKSQIADNIKKFIKKTDIPYEQMGVLLREFFDIYVY